MRLPLFSGISNHLVPIQFVHGYTSQEDRPIDHVKQHQQHQQQPQSLNHGHSFMKNIRQHSQIAQSKALQYDETHRNRAKGLLNDDDISISAEQILYFTNINVNENVKGK